MPIEFKYFIDSNLREIVWDFTYLCWNLTKDKGSSELQEHTEWFAAKTFGRRAEIVGENLHKGSRVYLEGRKRPESWDDKQTGAKHLRDLVYVDRIEFLDSKGSENSQREPAESACDETTVTDQEMPF